MTNFHAVVAPTLATVARVFSTETFVPVLRTHRIFDASRESYRLG
ncbi:hypothetical protein [Mycobacterium aquaticum]|nr:hypothetical protein [Mycobacterium aquaticum]